MGGETGLGSVQPPCADCPMQSRAGTKEAAEASRSSGLVLDSAGDGAFEGLLLAVWR